VFARSLTPGDVIAGLTRNLPCKYNACRMVGKEEKFCNKIVINDEITVKIISLCLAFFSK